MPNFFSSSFILACCSLRPSAASCVFSLVSSSSRTFSFWRSESASLSCACRRSRNSPMSRVCVPTRLRAAWMIVGFRPKRCAMLIPAEAPGTPIFRFVGWLERGLVESYGGVDHSGGCSVNFQRRVVSGDDGHATDFVEVCGYGYCQGRSFLRDQWRSLARPAGPGRV